MMYMNGEMRRFNHLMNEIDALYHEAARKLGLSDSALLILYTICHSGEECPISEITHASGASKQTINSALRKLEAENIVYLDTYSGRMKKVCLTSKGKELAANTVQLILDAENQVFGAWDPGEWQHYISLTQRYLDDFREQVKKMKP